MLYAHFTTSEGQFTIQLFEEKAPKTVANFTGRSPGLLVAVLPIFDTTSIPLTTSPKTLCLLSSHDVSVSVMKNCPPLLLGPLFAIDSMPALECRSVG